MTPDETLGAESSAITPNININGNPSDRIDGGAIRGTSLFHSFQEFNVGEGGAAYFANPVGIENILTRVTGNDSSDILGTLGVLGNANLFLLNPNGIVFGANARLDVRGSFVASTANGFVFENGEQFSATNPDAPPLLTVNLTPGLQYGSDRSAAIVNAGQLAVGEGQTLGLFAGTVASTGQLLAPKGQVAIATVPGESSSLSELLVGAGGWQNLGLTVTETGDVTLAESGLLVEAGDIAIAGGQDIESIQAGTATLWAARNLTLAESQLFAAGNLNLLAQGTVRVRDSIANPFSGIAGGNLYVQGDRGIDILALNHPQTPFQSAGNLSLVSDGIISGDAHFAAGGSFSILNTSGEPGNFVSLYDPIISSEGDVVLGDYTGVSLKVEAKGSITAGDITITGPDTTLTPGSDPDISILRSEPALILRAGVDSLENPPTSFIPVYSNDFEGEVLSELSNTSTDTTPVGNRRFLGRFSGSDSVSLTLDNLPPHEQATVSFDLFIIQSWDGNEIYCCNGLVIGPDIWKLSIVDGSTLLHTTFGNAEANSPREQAYPDAFPGGQNPPGTGAAENNTLGYKFGDPPKDNDSVYQLSFTFDHSDSSLQLNFSSALPGYTGIQDESWGLDNVRVSVEPTFTSSGVPSPGTIAVENLSTPGGRVILEASSDITLNGSITSQGGNISLDSSGTIDTTAGILDSFSVNQGGAITLSASGDIKAGDIRSSGNEGGGDIALESRTGEIFADGSVIIRSDAFISGRAGDVNLTARSVSLSNGARVLTGTERAGQGGNLTVTASETVELSGTSADGRILTLLSTSTGSSGDAGNLTINAERLIVREGAVIGASTSGAGRGGNLTVNASESVELIGTSQDGFPSGLSTDTIGAGEAGDLTINTRRLIAREGAAISASTFSEAKGGNLIVNAPELVELSGAGPNGFASGFYAQAFSDGNAGNLTINKTQNLRVQNGARVTVAAGTAAETRVPNPPRLDLFTPLPPFDPDATGNAGNISVAANLIFLDEGGAIVARTNSSEGGNISLQAHDLLLLRRNSEISATAGTVRAGGNGGNIEIDAPFIIAVPRENSDITANAFLGNGGNIDITAQGIYGLKFRIEETLLSDITASSEFGLDGVVNIDTPGIDPNRGLANLPQETASEGLIVSGCPSDRENTFTVTGRGGLPPNPGEALRSEAIVINGVMIQPGGENLSASATSAPPSRSVPDRIVEAQGWVINDRGQVVLIARAPTVTPSQPAFNSQGCYAP
jgi:filamentous hemagglutinin family protein